mmetsp:Transcript_16659/g.26998  ORF Transcript_16659/g.26998 Transcript_16659/m.26998 type:complete len:204 (-) Transcript_16659:7-618(-)
MFCAATSKTSSWEWDQRARFQHFAVGKWPCQIMPDQFRRPANFVHNISHRVFTRYFRTKIMLEFKWIFYGNSPFHLSVWFTKSYARKHVTFSDRHDILAKLEIERIILEKSNHQLPKANLRQVFSPLTNCIQSCHVVQKRNFISVFTHGCHFFLAMSFPKLLQRRENTFRLFIFVLYVLRVRDFVSFYIHLLQKKHNHQRPRI